MLAIALVLGITIGLKLQPVSAGSGLISSKEGNRSGRVEELIRYIENKYVDEVDRDALVDKAIESVLAELDPHSSYIPAEDFARTDEQMRGNFDGIGVEFMVLEDTVVIISPLPDGPSDQVGILAGDRIVMVGDSLIAGVNITSDQITEYLKGERGTKVEVGILREGESELRRFTITRGRIPVNSVDASYMIDDKIGYVRINRFSATTHKEFMDALTDLVEKQGMTDLIIDLRQNPGGYLNEATRMLNQLFEDRSKLLVYTDGRTVGRNDYETNGSNALPVEDIAVLINEGSASASEIMAGAIQDHDRGVIVGRRSFGKGLVQEQYELRDGSALRLTVAHYFTPSGRSIQKPYDDREGYDNDLSIRYQNGELSNNTAVALSDSTEYLTAGNRTVYGGGGITPDVFVPVDSLQYDTNFLKIRQPILEHSFRYTRRIAREVETMDAESFIRNFRVSRAEVDRYLDFVREREIQFDESTIEKFYLPLARELKARVGRQLYGESVFFQILNQDDEMVLKAIEVLKQNVPVSAMNGAPTTTGRE